MERKRRREIGRKGKRKIKKLNTKCRVKEMEINLLIEKLKQRLIAKKTKV